MRWAWPAAVALLASSCGGAGPGAANGGHIVVVASFYPLYEAATMVGGDRVAVTNLTPPGVEPHDLELSTTDVDAVLEADVLLYLGGGFQPAVEELAPDRQGVTSDLLRGRATIEGTEADGMDPHIWLDPLLMEDIVLDVAWALVLADPGGADGYRDRADDFVGEIRQLDRELRQGLADCDRRLIVTTHAAFGYLVRRYGLMQEPIAGVTPEAEPDPRRLGELADLVRATGTTTVFTEALVSPEVAETLAREAGVRTGVLDTLEGLSDEAQEAGDTYVSVMRRNLEALRAALGCHPR